MRRQLIPAFAAGLCLLLLLAGSPAFGQDSDQPLVVFVLNPDIDSASPFDAGQNGVSVLNDMFQAAGAQTQVINLVEPIPPDAKVVVLVGPRSRLSITSLIRLWVHLARGNHLLVALDPSGYGATDTEVQGAGLLELLDSTYGILAYDALMAENWFTKDSILLLSGAFLRSNADVVPHPVIAPLLDYDIPVEMWGARPMRIEPIGVHSRAVPLLQTSTAYGETNGDVLLFNGAEPPLEMNLETDIIGRVNLAGLGENSRFGSRVAVLGDSEMLRNGYGLAVQSDTRAPRYLGNHLLAERLVNWLLDVPEAEWPTLPDGYNRIELDGSGSDWDTGSQVTTDGLDSAPPTANLRAVRALRDDAYLYILAQTVGNPAAEVAFRLQFDAAGDEEPPIILADARHVALTAEDAEPLPIGDGKVVVGGAVEIRLPLRVVGDARQITELCALPNRNATEAADCLESPIPVVAVEGRAISDLRFPEGPLVIVTSVRDIALQERPAANAPSVASLSGGQVLRAVGRTSAGDWIQVETGAYTGWLGSSLVVANFDINRLPVVDDP